MDITILAAWGEFLGGIAVIASLVYLGLQVRQNSRLLRASTTAASSQVRQTPYPLIVQDPEVARIWWDGLEDRDSLSDADRRRFDPLMTMLFYADSQQYLFQCEGVGSPMQWDQVETGIRWQVRYPGVRQWFRDHHFAFGKEYCDYYEGLVREAEAAG